MDKDDLGHRNDIIRKGKRNEEFLEINPRSDPIFVAFNRVNILSMLITSLVKKRDPESATTVTLELVKLNPYEEIWAGSKEFTQRGQEETFVRFHMKENGRYFNINELPKNLVMKSMEYLSGLYSGDGSEGSMSPYPSSSFS